MNPATEPPPLARTGNSASASQHEFRHTCDVPWCVSVVSRVHMPVVRAVS